MCWAMLCTLSALHDLALKAFARSNTPCIGSASDIRASLRADQADAAGNCQNGAIPYGDRCDCCDLQLVYAASEYIRQ